MEQYTIKQLSKILGVSTLTLYPLSRKKILPFTKANGRLYLSESDLISIFGASANELEEYTHSVKTAALELGYSYNYFADLVRKRKIPSVNILGRPRLSQRSLKGFEKYRRIDL